MRVPSVCPGPKCNYTLNFYCEERLMKEGIHPKYGPAKVICACGKVWDIYSTRKEQKVGICAECHPFITGKQKLVDVAGRVEKFRRRYKKADAK